MALCHLSPLSCSLQNLCTFASSPKIEPSHLKFKSHQNPARRNLVLACSAEKSSKKGKRSRPTKNNEELCNELREFILAKGLPEDRVPLMKELLEHGRKDLANIVRRRGYKVITELLRNSSEKDTSTEKSSLGNQDSCNACRYEASEDKESNLNKSAEFVSSSSDSSLVENCMIRANGSIATGTVRTCEPSESSIGSLHVKATNFIHMGVLDTVEDAGEVENMDMTTEFELNSDILNSNVSDIASVPSRQVLPCSTEHQPDRNGAASGEVNIADFNVYLASEASERDNQIEIDRLKAMLHKKEMELSLLKQQIENEKQALTVLQAMANAQIGNAQRIVSAKDVELHAAEESLSGLKEVQIEYWADGETVEVAGSFNGWHHRVKMDLHPSSNTIDPSGSRKSKLWSTVLWLYPGMYEIKFIVDGHWRIDCQREIITSGDITNNVLRVD